MWKKSVAFGLATVLAVSCLAGCGKSSKKGGTTEKDIEIGYWNSGLGTDWLDAVIEAFEKKYPEYNVYYNPSASSNAVTTAFGMKDTDTTDLYMSITSYETDKMEPIDDVLSATADGESVTIQEKINAGYLNTEKAADGKYYTLTYGGGVLGIVYNKKMFEDAGVRTIPRTTDELEGVCDTLASSDMVPFCHFKTTGYWDFMSEAFFEQYDGADYYMNEFYMGEPSKEKFTKEDGRYETLKAYEKFITPAYVLQGSNSNDHVTMQTEFLSGKAAMMVSGSWLANEMASLGSVDNFAMMRTPVISAITDKLTTVKKDSDLRKLITAIDNVTDGVKSLSDYQKGSDYEVDGMKVSAADWEYVSNARKTVPANYSGESMFIPNYSNAKEGAKEFIKFLYSDEGYKVYADTLHLGLPLQMSEGELDTSKWNEFEKSQYNMFSEATQIATEYIMGKHKIFYDGGARSFADYQYVNKFCSNNVADLQSASEAWASIVERINNDYENNWMANIK